MDLGGPLSPRVEGERVNSGGEGPGVSPPAAAGPPRGLLQEEEGKDDGDTLELYQQSLGELLLLLAGEL